MTDPRALKYWEAEVTDLRKENKQCATYLRLAADALEKAQLELTTEKQRRVDACRYEQAAIEQRDAALAGHATLQKAARQAWHALRLNVYGSVRLSDARDALTSVLPPLDFDAHASYEEAKAETEAMAKELDEAAEIRSGRREPIIKDTKSETKDGVTLTELELSESAKEGLTTGASALPPCPDCGSTKGGCSQIVNTWEDETDAWMETPLTAEEQAAVEKAEEDLVKADTAEREHCEKMAKRFMRLWHDTNSEEHELSCCIEIEREAMATRERDRCLALAPKEQENDRFWIEWRQRVLSGKQP